MTARVAIACALVIAGGCTEAPLEAPQSVARFTLPPAPRGGPTAPGPAPRMRTFDAARVNAACETCHVDIAAEWQSSLHRRAHTDAAYQTQFAVEPLPFCTGCHAPEADPEAPVPEALSEIGVGCVTCHVVGSDVLAAPADAPGPSRHHAVRRQPAFATAAACAGCHEFGFPSAQDRALKMQATVSEHAASAFADRSCATCHMPLTEGPHDGAHRSHAFAASRDAATLRSAVDVYVSLHDDTVRFELKPVGVGHALPTGDMLRRIALRLAVHDAAGNLVEEHEHHLTRHFGFVRSAHKPLTRVVLDDDRPGASAHGGKHVHRLRESPPGGSVHYRVRYERVHDPREPVTEGTVLAQGTLAL